MNDQLFKLDKLTSNIDYIKKHCNHFKSNDNDKLSKKIDDLLEASKFIDEVSKQFAAGNTNGFVLYNKILTSYTDQLCQQIKNKNKLDTNFLKILNLMFTYKDWLIDTYEALEKQDQLNNNESSKEKSLMVKKATVSSESFYIAIHANSDVLPLIFSTYTGFWLSKELQKALHFLCFSLAITRKLPMSLSTLWSSKSEGKYCVKAYKNCNLENPFNFWHQSEGVFVKKFLNYVVNRSVPVKSVTLNIPRQNRFRISYKGEILDLQSMEESGIEEYLNDEEEKKRQKATGVRHRNGETIRCRYSYITSEDKIKASLERIRKSKDAGDNFKFLKYQTINKTGNQKQVAYANKVKELKIYEPISLINDTLESNETPKKNKKKKKFKNPKYIGLKYDEDDTDEFKEVPLQKNENDDDFKFNEQRIVVMHIHGGALFTQGSQGAELYLRSIVDSLGGVPILAVDYSLTVPFPLPVQEILDVYLWLFSGEDEVKKLLGFHPKKIVLSGDSAGGLLSLTLTILINELNKLLDKSRETNPVPRPSSIVAIYPASSICSMFPSLALFVLEPLVEYHLYLMMFSIYGANLSTIGDFKKIEKSERFQEIALKNKKLFDDKTLKDDFNYGPFENVKDSMPWFHCDYATYRNNADYICSFYQNPLIDPGSYQFFDELGDTKLFTLVGEYDFLIDNSNQLAKFWKGDLCFDILSNLIHGFLSMKTISNENRESVALVIKRFQESCGLI